ncbi:hypothetical protein C7S14_7991 [Burkholderia cepacia]|nr:hypothetical protein C7S14_7991 [Burkholderia cepacia]
MSDLRGSGRACADSTTRRGTRRARHGNRSYTWISVAPTHV